MAPQGLMAGAVGHVPAREAELNRGLVAVKTDDGVL